MRGRYELFLFLFVPVYTYTIRFTLTIPPYFSTHAHCIGPDRPDDARENRAGEAVRHAHGEAAKICARSEAYDVCGRGVSISTYTSQCKEVECGIQGTTMDPRIHYMIA